MTFSDLFWYFILMDVFAFSTNILLFIITSFKSGNCFYYEIFINKIRLKNTHMITIINISKMLNFFFKKI